jgi:hypothetical protein
VRASREYPAVLFRASPRRRVGSETAPLVLVAIALTVLLIGGVALAATLEGTDDDALTGTGEADTIKGYGDADAIYDRPADDAALDRLYAGGRRHHFGASCESAAPGSTGSSGQRFAYPGRGESRAGARGRACCKLSPVGENRFAGDRKDAA